MTIDCLQRISCLMNKALTDQLRLESVSSNRLAIVLNRLQILGATELMSANAPDSRAF